MAQNLRFLIAQVLPDGVEQPEIEKEFAMKGATKERWQLLCELAQDEQDPERLMQLVQEINRLLEEKERRLKLKHAARPTQD